MDALLLARHQRKYCVWTCPAPGRERGYREFSRVLVFKLIDSQFLDGFQVPPCEPCWVSEQRDECLSLGAFTQQVERLLEELGCFATVDIFEGVEVEGCNGQLPLGLQFGHRLD